MPKFSVDIPDDLYTKIKTRALDETIRQAKFVGMNDLIIPLLKKEFEK